MKVECCMCGKWFNASVSIVIEEIISAREDQRSPGAYLCNPCEIETEAWLRSRE